MSVYRPRRSDGSYKTPYYHYDFKLRPEGQRRSVRFYGSTGQTARAKALAVERRVRELAAEGRLTSDMTVNQACWQYWEEWACRQPSSEDTAFTLEVIRRLLGADTLLTDIDESAIADAVRRRAGEQVMRRRKSGNKLVKRGTGKLVSNSTVNRTLTEPLRRLLRYARRVWKVPIDPFAIDWASLRLPENAERSRELQEDEESRFWAALRPDYHPIVEIYLISGRRKMDWIGLKRFKIDLKSQTVRVPSRKKKRPGEIVVELTAREAQILAGEMRRSTCEEVFTYEVQRGEHKGERRPITASGFRRVFGNALAAAGIDDFRTHDLRHTFGSRLTRLTGNLKMTQQALGHSDISTTVRYAHITGDEVRRARAQLTVSRNSPGAVDITAAGSGKKGRN